MSDKRVNALLSAELFCSLSATEKQEISSLCEEINIPKGEAIFLQNKLGCLVKGGARVEVKNGTGTVMKRLSVGDIFGCASLFEGGAVTNIKADRDSRLVCISQENMVEIFGKYPTVSVDYIKYLSGKIRYLNSRIGDFAPAPVEQKVLGFLRKSAKAQNPVKIPMTFFAKELGIGRTSLYRALDTLENNKLIIRRGNEITVL